MKKNILLMAAVATAIGFAACNGSGGEGTMTKEQADSMANAKADSTANALKAQNDSLIAAQAAAEAMRADSARIADSLFAAGKKAGATASKPNRPSTGGVKPAPPAPTPKPEEVKPVDPKAARFDQDAKKKVDEAVQQKKADRFNRK